MCRRVTCVVCNKPTFAGCGAHIEQVLGDVPKEQRCTCREKGAESKAKTAPSGPSGSWLSGLFGKK